MARPNDGQTRRRHREHDAAMPSDDAAMIAAHVRWMRAGAFSPDTIDSAEGCLMRASRALPTGVATAYPEELADRLANPDWSPQTKATNRQHLQRFFAWAVEGGWLSYDPSTKLRRPRVEAGEPRPATDEQVAAILAGAVMPWRLHCVLAAYAGLRCLEIARLDRTDITQTTMYVHGKGDRSDTIPTHAVVWALVADLPAGPVTRTLRGWPATAEWVSACTNRYLHRLGIPVTMHQLRHWYGTRLLEACGDLRVVQTLLRHRSVATTQIYTRVVEGRRHGALAQLPDLTGDAPADRSEIPDA